MLSKSNKLEGMHYSSIEIWKLFCKYYVCIFIQRINLQTIWLYRVFMLICCIVVVKCYILHRFLSESTHEETTQKQRLSYSYFLRPQHWKTTAVGQKWLQGKLHFFFYLIYRWNMMEHMRSLVVPSLFWFKVLSGDSGTFMNLWMDGDVGQEHLPDFLEALESSATPKFWRCTTGGVNILLWDFLSHRHGRAAFWAVLEKKASSC